MFSALTYPDIPTVWDQTDGTTRVETSRTTTRTPLAVVMRDISRFPMIVVGIYVMRGAAARFPLLVKQVAPSIGPTNIHIRREVA